MSNFHERTKLRQQLARNETAASIWGFLFLISGAVFAWSLLVFFSAKYTHTVSVAVMGLGMLAGAGLATLITGAAYGMAKSTIAEIREQLSVK